MLVRESLPRGSYLAPSALRDIKATHPGRCPGLLHFAPLALSGVSEGAPTHYQDVSTSASLRDYCFDHLQRLVKWRQLAQTLHYSRQDPENVCDVRLGIIFSEAKSN